MTNYCTDIIFAGKVKSGKVKGAQYKPLAFVYEDEPERMYLAKDKDWFTKDEDFLMFLVIKILVHEPIHHILWKHKLDPHHSGFDVVRGKFIRKECKGKSKKFKRRLKSII